MRQKLNTKWTLQALRPYARITEDLQPGNNKQIYTDPIPATVPGGVHLDLFHAGLIPNPYYGRNSILCEWTEHRWWKYETDIAPDPTPCKTATLIFGGVDYKANYYINDRKVAESENMFVPVEIDVTDYIKDGFNLKVVIENSPFDMGQWGKTSDTFTQKSRFNFGWDFATRLVNMGIWDDVYLEFSQGARLLDTKIISDYNGVKGEIFADYHFSGSVDEAVSLTLLSPQGEVVEKQTASFAQNLSFRFELDKPQLWFPNGYGDQPLYTLTLTCGDLVCEKRIGVRRIEYKDNRTPIKSEVKYTVVINGKELFLRGANKVPLDHLYGTVKRKDYEFYVKRLAEMGANICRCWGGGIIEKEDFYDLCDEYGILIWQEFIQSSSHVEHVPSVRPEFLEKIQATAEYAVKLKRNHVCLAFWSGGNELTAEDGKPVNFDHKNIALLREIAQKYNPEIQMVPSSPYGDVYMFNFETEGTIDIHGCWLYMGNPEFYQGYNSLNMLFHSEYALGSSPVFTIPFMDEGDDTPDAPRGSGYYLHGGYWYREDVLCGTKALFGDFENYKESLRYQWVVQSEGYNYIVEEDRRRESTSGSIIWQLNEPWPNAEGTSLVDYFGVPRPAYYRVKQAMSNFPFSLRYDNLQQTTSLDMEVHSFFEDAGDCYVTVYDRKGDLLFKETVTEFPQKLHYELNTDSDLLLVRISDGVTHKEYTFGREEKPYAAMRTLSPALSYTIKEERENGFTAEIKNDGNEIAWMVHLHDKNHILLADSMFFALLPGETREVKIEVQPLRGLFFERNEDKLLSIICDGLHM